MLHEDKQFLLAVRDSLRRTIKYHKGALGKIKKSKSKKRLDAEKLIKHNRELEGCNAALEKVVNALDDLKPNQLV